MSIKLTAALMVFAITVLAGILAYIVLGVPSDPVGLLTTIFKQSPQIIAILSIFALAAILVMFWAFISLFQIESKAKARYST